MRISQNNRPFYEAITVYSKTPNGKITAASQGITMVYFKTDEPVPQWCDEVMQKIAKDQTLIEFATTTGRAFILVAQLQLALRAMRDQKGGKNAIAISEQMVNHLAEAIAEAVDDPRAIQLIAMGAHPEFDVETDSGSDS